MIYRISINLYRYEYRIEKTDRYPALITTSVFLRQRVGGGGVRRCWVNFQCLGVLLIWIIVGQGPIVLAVGAGGGLSGHFFSAISSLFFLPHSG